MTTPDGIILARAIALAADIHKNDLYGNEPYIFHLLQVAKSVREETIDIQVLAIFHDALEAHPEAAGRIYDFLLGVRLEELFTSLTAISRHYFGTETYNDFIERLTLDYRATVVKLADLQRNSAPKEGRTEHHVKLALERYIPAMAKVTKALLAHIKERTSNE